MNQKQAHVHQNELDSNLTPEQRRMAEHTIATFGLRNLKITWIDPIHSLRFAQDRRVVTVPWSLYERECWTDIRHLFRAILGNAPATMNRTAPNEWGPVDDAMDNNSSIEQK